MGTKRYILMGIATAVLLLSGYPCERGASANERPRAEAGPLRYAGGDPIQLDGSGSYDPDQSGLLTYAWKQIAGPPLVLTGGDTAVVTINGPGHTNDRGLTIPGIIPQTDAIQECQFELVVSDGELTSLPDTVKVLIVPTFTNCTMTLENAFFDPEKPTLLYFHGGTSEQTGGGRLNRTPWSEKANVISFPSYVGDPGTFAGAQADKSYMRPGDMIIVYLSAVAPDYRQPIQTLGWSIGGLLALDVARHLNLTYADPRYAVNHACLLDPSAWVMGTPEFHRRVAELLAHPVTGEQCWVASLEAANASVCPSALNIVFSADHALPWNWYLNSLGTLEDAAFNHGVLAGAYWSVVGPGRNLQLALTPEVQTYKFRWIGSATQGEMVLYNELDHPGCLPEPVTLGAWIHRDSLGNTDGAVLSCRYSENAAGYQLLFGSDPDRVMDYTVVSDTPAPPMEILTEFPDGQIWWTIRVRDQYGSTIHADPVRLELAGLPSLSIENARTGRRYGLLSHAAGDAESGDILLLDPGIYDEGIEFGGKTLAIRSLDPTNPDVVAATIIKGNKRMPVVLYSGAESADCGLQGLTIQSSTLGISCRDARPTISNCVVDCPQGIALEYWHARAPTLIDCTISGRVKEGGDPGLVAYWKLDEAEGVIASDSEGTNDATVIGGASWQPEAGRVRGALQFDGVDDYLAAGVSVNPGTGPFSVFAWVQGGAPGQVILSQAEVANWLRAAPATGTLGTELNEPGRNAATNLPSPAVITDGAWHRVGLVWDGVSRALYVDDVEVARGTLSKLPDSIKGMQMGVGSTLAAGTFWSGLIDDVRIYNRAVKP